MPQLPSRDLRASEIFLHYGELQEFLANHLLRSVFVFYACRFEFLLRKIDE